MIIRLSKPPGCYQTYIQVSSNFMENRRTISLVLGLSIITAILLPIFLADKNESSNAIVIVIATIISALASTLTLCIALLLFNKFGIETPLLEKNTTVVFAFIEQFKKTSLFIKNDGQKYFLNVRLEDPFNTSFERFYGDKLAFSTDYITGLEKLFMISDSPFMPKKISEKVAKIRCSYLTHLNEEELNSFSKVIIPGKKSEDDTYGEFNDQEMTLMQFLGLLDDIKIEVINWICKNSNYKPDLNF
jgi:hypothetical protein